MKNLMKIHARFWLLGALFLASASSCKEGSIFEPFPITSTQSLASNQCYLHVEHYDVYGQLVYDFLNFKVATADPAAYLEPSTRDTIVKYYTAAVEETAGMNTLETLDYYLANGQISAAMHSTFSSFYQNLMSLIDAQTNLDSIANQIDVWASQISSRNDLDCTEKEILLAVHSQTKYFLKYFSDIWGPNGENYPLVGNEVLRGGSCGFFKKLRCFVDGFLKGVSLIPPSLGAAFFVLGSLTGNIVVGVALFGALYTGVGIIIGGNEVGICCPQQIDCNAPMGVSIDFVSCVSALFVPFGFGMDAVELAWNNDNGDPPAAVTPADNPGLVIRQISDLEPLKVNIATHCGGGVFLKPFEKIIDLIQEAKSVSNVVLTGPTAVDPSSGLQYTYTAINVIQHPDIEVSWSVVNGQILASGENFITVVWDPSMENGSVQLTVRSNCPGGEVRTLVYDVVAGGDIP